MTAPSDISTYARLCARATPESLRRNPRLALHMPTFFRLAKHHGLPLARAWLLGTLVFDNYPHTDTPSAPRSHPSPNHPTLHHQSSNPQLARLQQHVETAAHSTLHLSSSTPPL